MQKLPCPLCRSQTARPVWQKIYSHLTVTTVLCPICGLVYHNPPVEDRDRQDLSLSHRELHTDTAIHRRNLQRVGQRVARQAAFLETVIQPGWRSLEIGCGLGILSDWLSRQRCVTLGIEPDEQQAKYAAKRFGLKVLQGRFEEVDLDQHFDFLASSHVIEHIPDPLLFLRRLRALATSRTLLFLETPNILAPKVGPTRVFSLAHNFYFSPQTLAAALAKTGWQVIRTRIFQRDSFMILAHAAPMREPQPQPGHAAEVWRAILRHRRNYYLYLLFFWRKIPLWRRYWMYRFQDYPGPPLPINFSV